MKSTTKKIFVLILLGMGFMCLPNIKLNFSFGQKSNVKIPKQSAAYTESFIHVDGNWTLTATKAWCDGLGTWQEPYVIEDVTIDSGGTGSGIFINNSKNDYFIIRNCTVYNAGSGTYDAGIKLENTNNGTLTNNNCSNNPQYGILLLNFCYNNTISGNIANDNDESGIYLYQSNNNTISGNIANNNTEYGIHLYQNDYNSITGNTANDNDESGIYLYQSNNNTISENNANDNQNGICLESSCDFNTFSGNTANGNQNGIFF